MQINKQQITKIHVLLHSTGLMSDKADLVLQVSNGRVKSTRELTMQEASRLIDFLNKLDGKEAMRRKVYALAYKAGIIYGDTIEDRLINRAKLDAFLQRKGTVKKPLGFMGKQELISIVNQFEGIVKHNGQTMANKATRSLLNELSIPVMKH